MIYNLERKDGTPQKPTQKSQICNIKQVGRIDNDNRNIKKLFYKKIKHKNFCAIKT